MLFSPYASIWNQAEVLSDEYFLMTDVALLEGIFSDQAITDILLDGSNTALIEKNGKLEAINPLFQNENELNQWARNIMNLNNSRLDIAKPIAEVTLDTLVGLLRIHAVLAGECSKRTQVSIRRHTISSLSLESLLSSASLDENQLVILRQIIFQKENFVIIGGTGSGKTTLLKAMLNEVSNERVITIQDLLVAHTFIANIDEAKNHFQVRSLYANELGNALAVQMDKHIFQTVYNASKATALDPQAAGQSVTEANFLTDGKKAAEAIYAAAQILDENDVPESDRFAAVSPAVYYNMIKDTTAATINRDFGGQGSFADGNVFKIAGIQIVKTNNLPSGTISSGVGSGSIVGGAGNLGGTFTNDKAVVWHKSCSATLKLLDLSTEMEYSARHQGTLMVAKYAVGHGVLRPEASVIIKTA
jgi:molybdopterin-guanine dinucleotide biosynthesis protein